MSRIVQVKDVAKINLATFKKDDFPTNFKYLDTSSLTKNKVEHFQFLNIHTDVIPSRAQRKIKQNTILYSTVRPNQEHYGIIEKLPDNIVVSTGFATLDVIDNEINPKYLFYLLTQPHITEYLHTIATNSVSAYPSISPNDLGNLKFRVPELSSQQKIAAVLTTLDSKIELNNRINAELEAMAKMIYDYWFVQFDFPDENGKPYKSSGGKMVWNEELKREIPEGWEVKKLNECMRIIRGASPRPIDDFMSNSGAPWIKISDATAINHWFIVSTKEFIKEDGVRHSRELQPGTLILSNSASPGIPRIVQIRSCVHDGWLIVDTFQKGLYNEFMLFYFENFRSKILNMGSGSIFKNLKTEYIKDLLITLPSIEMLSSSRPIFQNISDQILNNVKENQKLTELRDWLLPMLMNGQVRVD